MKEATKENLITCEMMELWFEHLEKHRPDDVFKDIPTDDAMKYYTSRLLKKRLLTKEQRMSQLEFYVEGFALLKKIDVEKVKKMPISEVRQYVDNFRTEFE